MTRVPSSSRRRSRILAFQVLFEVDVSEKDIATTLKRQLDQARVSTEAANFVQHLVLGVTEHRDKIDSEIARRAESFPLTDMAPVDRNVLRLAIFEMLFDNLAAPLRVVINEAVDIAKGYGSESSGRFVNGVLGSVALTTSDENQ